MDEAKENFDCTMPSSTEHCDLCPLANISPSRDKDQLLGEGYMVSHFAKVLLYKHHNWGPITEFKRPEEINAAQELAARGCASLIMEKSCEMFRYVPFNGLSRK